MIKTLVSYFSQSSTWNGLVALATAFGISIKPELSTAIIAAGLGLAGLVKVFIEGSTMELKAKAADKADAGVS